MESVWYYSIGHSLSKGQGQGQSEEEQWEKPKSQLTKKHKHCTFGDKGELPLGYICTSVVRGMLHPSTGEYQFIPSVVIRYMASLLDESIAISPTTVSVQELIKRPLDSVPKRFIRLDSTPQAGPSDLDGLPTIDMKKLLGITSDSSDESFNGELGRLHFSCREWGIFQLVNHGVSSSFLQQLRHEIEGFFKLPLKEKMKYKANPGESDGYGNVVRTEKNHLDWGDRLFMTINPISKRKPHLFPELPPSLRSTLETYIQELKKIAIQILKCLAICLGIDTNLMMDLFKEEKGLETLRATYYPPCPQPELVVGLTPHSDATAITILHQITNCVNGLQIKRNGMWFPVDIPDDAFIVNMGDIMEIISNGAYPSIEHRAMVNTESERISIAMFFNPRLDAQVGPAASLVSPKSPARFRRFIMDEYVKGFFAHPMNGKSYLNGLKIMNEASDGDDLKEEA
ncbi:hypothetical protein SAY86_019398 [Trapa natans]|uniref:Fe2OG dioxygenase domain-containing protein n=1 Tax=Trapa natans TaxID=22666 RepID=A0AAN7LN41_TRANT|nr:hypothetical protein SAY86_019398 [Trapa natans]